MMGILLQTEGRFAEAVEAFEQAESLGHSAAASTQLPVCCASKRQVNGPEC